MDGYWKQPELTAETIRDGWLHTGDMATCDDDGFLTIVDRKKDMIVTGGFNVFPREIEDVLTSHPAVAGAAVIGVPDDKWGEAVTALVVTRPGQDVSPGELIALVKERKGNDRRAQGCRVHRRHPAHPRRQGRQALAARPLLGRQRSVGALEVLGNGDDERRDVALHAAGDCGHLVRVAVGERDVGRERDGTQAGRAAGVRTRRIRLRSRALRQRELHESRVSTYTSWPGRGSGTPRSGCAANVLGSSRGRCS